MFDPSRNVPPRMRMPCPPGPLPRGPFLESEPDGFQRQPPPWMEEGHAPHWDHNPFPARNRNWNCPPSEGMDEFNTRGQRCYTDENASSILANFGLSNEDLEELSHYPDNQLTPGNMPFILRDIRMRKTARQGPSFPPQFREKGSFHDGDGGCSSMMKTRVFNYGPENRHGIYNPREASEGGRRGFQPQQAASVPVAANNPMNAVEGPTHQLGFQGSPRNMQPFPCRPRLPSARPMGTPAVRPMRPPMSQPVMPPAFRHTLPQTPVLPDVAQSLKPDHRPGFSTSNPTTIPPGLARGQKKFSASPRPFRSQTETQMMQKLPTPSMMNDYYAVSPKVFPHVCSLCNFECGHSEDWNKHLNTTTHMESCCHLRQQYPSWTPQDLPLSKRSPGHRRTKRSRSATPRSRSRSPRRSPGSSSRSPGPRHSKTAQSRERHGAELERQQKTMSQAVDCREGSKDEPGSSTLAPLAEQSVLQAMSLLQAGGGAAGDPSVQGMSLPLSSGLVSMIQLVATQVVQSVLGSKKTSSGEASPSVAAIPPKASVTVADCSAKTAPDVQASPSVPASTPKASSSVQATLAPKETSSVQASTSVHNLDLQLRAFATKQKNQKKLNQQMACSGRNQAFGVQRNGQQLQAPGMNPAMQQQQQQQGPGSGASLPAGPGSGVPAVTGFCPKKIWIVGHSLVFWAHQRAAASIGVQLGFTNLPPIEWFGLRGMLWKQLVPRITEVARCGRQPELLVFHLGEDDLPHISAVELVSKIVEDLHLLHQMLPRSRIVWVNWLPRRIWRGAHNPKALDVARRKVNKKMHKIMQWRGGSVIPQPGIYFGLPHLFRADGVHLSQDGCDLYLSNLSAGIKQVLEADGMDEGDKLG